MKNKINWNKKNKAILEDMYNKELTDAQITEFFGCGAWAVAKQRSKMGLTAFVKQKNVRQSPRMINNCIENTSILMYQINGVRHIVRLDCNLSDAKLQNIANKLLDKNKDIKSIVALKPSFAILRNNKILKEIFDNKSKTINKIS